MEYTVTCETLAHMRNLVTATSDLPGDTPISARIRVGGKVRTVTLTYDEHEAAPISPYARELFGREIGQGQ